MMYRPFQICSAISVLLAILLFAGFRFHIAALSSTSFYSIMGIYYLMTFVIFLILLFKDHKIIFAKSFALKNVLLYILTTPIPLLIAFMLPYSFAQIGGDVYLHRDVSDFEICEACIKENEPVEVIYRSAGPEFNNDLDFYYHCIGVSGSTKDTFNILTTAKVYVFPENSRFYFSKTMLKIVENMQSLDSSSNINDLKLKDIQKVAIDGDDLLGKSYMRYKTVIGELVTIPGEK